MGDQSADIVPDTKDWTWTLQRRCPDCGFDAGRVGQEEVAAQVLALSAPWPEVLSRATARERPAPGVWSPLEYACHIRDGCRVFEGRVRLMLERDTPDFENWDQDATAVAERYGAQDPTVVTLELGQSAERLAATFAAVGEDQWGRVGVRSDGSRFTVLTLGQYYLHDLAHHLVDVQASSTL